MWYKLQPLVKEPIAILVVSYLVTVIVRIATGITLYPREGEIAAGLVVGTCCAWFWLWATSNPPNSFYEMAGQFVALVVSSVVWISEVFVACFAGDGWVSAEFTLVTSVLAQLVGIAIFKEVERPFAVRTAGVSPSEHNVYSTEDVEVFNRNEKKEV